MAPPTSLCDPRILVYVCRHGETTANKDHCFRGRLNLPLNVNGVRQADELAGLFAPIDLAILVSSPKLRSMQTSRAIAACHPGLEIQEHPGLMALDVGEFTGQKKTPAAKEQLQYYVDNPDVHIPGGESINQFRARVQPLLRDAVKLAQCIGRPVMISAHSSVVLETSHLFAGDVNHARVKPGGAAAIYGDGERLRAEPVFRPDPRSDKLGSIS